ncbi:hypothetical protein [Anaeromyxobacter dehalogenans]|uniref:hypothetical protein n=1 Tax=Anaeromyxobacter dehalogenans TaxID=161493 RepID=UPI00031BAF61|nr:hypothetical protein [Anaeromyxobacter dehalogenans]
MTAADRRLAAAAAALASGRAQALLARGPSPAAAEEAARLARLPGRARLEALAAAVEPAPAERRARAEAAAAAERPRVARLLAELALGGAPPADVAGALVRLCRERVSG